MFISGKTTQWLDYLPSRALALIATISFSAVAMEDGSVNVYSLTGRKCVSSDVIPLHLADTCLRLMPTLSLGSPCAFMDGANDALMLLTSSGQLYSWYKT